MSHRKIHSQGSVPFSWEDKPGVSRISRQDCASASPDSADSGAFNDKACVGEIKIPLPPCPTQQPLHKSVSSKGLIGWWEEDPFLAAYKECTKSARSTIKMSTSEMCKRSGVGANKLPWKKSNKFILSCKNSCEVREDNFVRLSNLPPLPKERIRIYR